MKSIAFAPHPLFRGGHVQTVAGMYLPSKFVPEQSTPHHITLPDGDVIILHENTPASWSNSQPVVLLMHGLAGCHQSPYLLRIARKLNDRGYRTFRMDLRGCGAGVGLARLPYHAGRSDDALRCAEYLALRAAGSPLAVVGFSLSGNVTLKLVGENPEKVQGLVRCAVAVNPPIDLAGCVSRLSSPINRFYDRFFTKRLHRQILWITANVPSAPVIPFKRPPRGLWEFDEYFTAPVSGYENAAHYYRTCSAAQFLCRVQIPTMILTSADDPLVPVSSFKSAELSPAVELRIAESGGHLGYIGRQNGDPDRRWMDWRIIDWLEQMMR